MLAKGLEERLLEEEFLSKEIETLLFSWEESSSRMVMQMKWGPVWFSKVDVMKSLNSTLDRNT